MYEKQVKELMDYYGLEKSVAQEIVSSHTQNEVEVILNFYANYGKLIKLK
jgi:Glu-tRNA(Gln) amidotransferase subunit E-like FAD-binding protein